VIRFNKHRKQSLVTKILTTNLPTMWSFPRSRQWRRRLQRLHSSRQRLPLTACRRHSSRQRQKHGRAVLIGQRCQEQHCTSTLITRCTGRYYTVRVKRIPPEVFWHFFQRLGIFSPNFTCLLHVPIYVRLQIFIVLSPDSNCDEVMPHQVRPPSVRFGRWWTFWAYDSGRA